MIPIERAHYRAWAQRLEVELVLAYPRTLWWVLHEDERMIMTLEVDSPQGFQVVAVPPGTRRHISVDVPFSLIVDEESFPVVVEVLGRELERRLKAMVGKG